jgi:hypothetical protein
MDVSGDDTGLLRRNDWGRSQLRRPANRRNTVKTTIKYVAPWLAAAAIGGAIALSPVASADPGPAPVSQAKVVTHPIASSAAAPSPFGSGEDPLVPSGANPYVPYVLGFPLGGVDLPS